MCDIKKEKKIRMTAEALYKKRYEGNTELVKFLDWKKYEHKIDIVEQNFMYPKFIKDDDYYGETECQREFGKFSDNFISGMVPRKREIFFTENLLNELNEIAEESDVELSTLINCYLLQMLERNKRTTEHTKARKAYVKNSLYATATYIDKVETLEEFEANIFDKEFIKYKELSYKNHSIDEEVYIQNYLLNKGYSIEQIEKIVREEKEIQGTFMSEEGEVMNPKTIHMEMIVKECPALNMDYDVHLFIPARLGLHYLLMNKVDTFRKYEDVEAFLKSKLKGDLTIWDLYAKYLENSLI